MKLLVPTLCLLLYAPTVLAAGSEAMTTIENGLQLAFGEPEIDGKPVTEELQLHPIMMGRPGAALRVIAELSRMRYFAYQVRAEVVGNDQARIIIEPLSEAAHEEWRGTARRLLPERPEPVSLEAAAIQYPLPEIVPIGSTFRLALLENPKTGETVYDTITVRWPKGPRPNEELALTEAKLRVNGDLLDNAQSCRGRIIYLYAPGTGRILLSRVPRVGFDQFGAYLWNELLTLVLDGNTFHLRSKEPIQSFSPPIPSLTHKAMLPFRIEPDWKPPEGSLPGPHAYLAGAADPADYPEVSPPRRRPAPGPSAPDEHDDEPASFPALDAALWLDLSGRPIEMLREGDEPGNRARDPERRVYRCRIIVRDLESTAVLLETGHEFATDRQGVVNRRIDLPDGRFGRLIAYVAADRRAGTVSYALRIVGPNKSVIFSQSADFSIDF